MNSVLPAAMSTCNYLVKFEEPNFGIFLLYCSFNIGQSLIQGSRISGPRHEFESVRGNFLEEAIYDVWITLGPCELNLGNFEEVDNLEFQGVILVRYKPLSMTRNWPKHTNVVENHFSNSFDLIPIYLMRVLNSYDFWQESCRTLLD